MGSPLAIVSNLELSSSDGGRLVAVDSSSLVIRANFCYGAAMSGERRQEREGGRRKKGRERAYLSLESDWIFYFLRFARGGTISSGTEGTVPTFQTHLFRSFPLEQVPSKFLCRSLIPNGAILSMLEKYLTSIFENIKVSIM